MKVTIKLTGDQFKDLVQKLALPHVIEVNIDIEEPATETIVPENIEWPDVKDSEPAKALIEHLTKPREDGTIKPSELPQLSYQRVLRLSRTDYQKKRHGLYLRKIDSKMHSKVEEVERTLGVKFKVHDKPTDAFIELFKEVVPKNYDKVKVSGEIHAMKTMMKPKKGIANIDKEYKPHHLTYLLYTHGIYTLADLKTLEYDEIKDNSLLEKMYEMVWSNC